MPAVRRLTAVQTLEARSLLSGEIHPFGVTVPASIAEGATINQGIASFHDTVPDPIGNYVAVIDWGDGTPTTSGAVSDYGNGIRGVNGSHAYARPGNFAVKVTLHDGPVGLSSTASAFRVGDPLAVTPVNDAPIGGDDSLGTRLEDTVPLEFPVSMLLANDLAGPAGESDEAAQTLTVTAVGDGTGGTPIFIGTLVLFVPAPHYHGPAGFTYTIRDNGTDNGTPAPRTATARASFTIAPVNDAPAAASDALTGVAEDSGQRTIPFATLTANDVAGPTNEAGQALTITGFSDVVGGSVALSNGNIFFTPAADFNGTASFRYTVSDNGTTNGLPDPRTATATASFTVTPVNDAPRAFADDLTATNGSGPRTISSATLTNNDSPGPGDESGQTLTVTAVSNVVGGTAVMSGSSVAFTASPDFAGAASFTYTVADNGTTNGVADPRATTATASFAVVPLPAVRSAAYLFDAAAPAVRATLSPGASVDFAGITLVRDTPAPAGVAVPVSYVFDPQARIVQLAYAGPGGVLPDGTYHLSIHPTAVTNARGETLSTPYRHDFHVLAGDADRDRAVNFSDLLVLAGNYNQAGRSFSRGDFNYDGTVNFADLLILAGNYNRTLAVAATPRNPERIDHVAGDVLAAS